jgi:hypothetical protein
VLLTLHSHEEKTSRVRQSLGTAEARYNRTLRIEKAGNSWGQNSKLAYWFDRDSLTIREIGLVMKARADRRRLPMNRECENSLTCPRRIGRDILAVAGLPDDLWAAEALVDDAGVTIYHVAPGRKSLGQRTVHRSGTVAGILTVRAVPDARRGDGSLRADGSEAMGSSALGRAGSRGLLHV